MHIVIAWGQGFMEVTDPSQEGPAQGQVRAVYVAINPWQSCYNYYIPMRCALCGAHAQSSIVTGTVNKLAEKQEEKVA